MNKAYNHQEIQQGRRSTAIVITKSLITGLSAHFQMQTLQPLIIPSLRLFIAFIFVSLFLLHGSISHAATWTGYKGERVKGAYSFGWPKEASPTFKTYSEALQWTKEEARKPGAFWYDPNLIVSNNITLFFSENVNTKKYDYYGHNYHVTSTQFTGGPDNQTGEPRCYPGDWVPYCADHTAVNKFGHFIYAKTTISNPSGVAVAGFGLCSDTIDSCNNSTVLPQSEWRANTSLPVVAVYEVDVTDPLPKNLGACGINNPGPQISNPIHVGTGNKYLRERDDVSGTFVTFTRAYNSLFSGPSPIGRNWIHNYGRYIDWRPDDQSNARVTRGDGATYFFSWDGSQWIGSSELEDTLERVLDGSSNPIGWRYTTGNKTVEDYDDLGKLLSMADVEGNAQTLTYDANNQLDRVDTPTGEFLQFDYDASGHLATVTDHASRAWAYRYDINNNLEFVDRPDGTTKQYHYNETTYTSGANLPSALTGITDERGVRYATYEYYFDGRAKSSYHAGNVEKVDISYNGNISRTIINSLGQPSTYLTTVQLGVVLVTDVSGPGCSTCGTGNTSYDYDPLNNNLLSRTENSVTSTFNNFDSNGQFGCKVEGITPADTSTGVCAFNSTVSPEARRTDYSYDPRFLSSITEMRESSVFGANP